MEARNPRLRVRFELEDEENGCDFRSESNVVMYDGQDVLIEIGSMLNNFLRQCGYPRHNDFIYMEDVTEDEYEYLDCMLYERRNGIEDDENGENGDIEF